MTTPKELLQEYTENKGKFHGFGTKPLFCFPWVSEFHCTSLPARIQSLHRQTAGNDPSLIQDLLFLICYQYHTELDKKKVRLKYIMALLEYNCFIFRVFLIRRARHQSSKMCNELEQSKKYLEIIHNTLIISFSLRISNNPSCSDLLINCQKIMRPAAIWDHQTKIQMPACLWVLALSQQCNMEGYKPLFKAEFKFL